MEEKLEKAKFSSDIKKRVRELQPRDNWHNIFTIAFDWLVIIGSILLVNTFPTWWMYLIAIIIIGSRMRAFDNLMHEASHFQLFKNKKLNKWIACFFVAFPVFTSFTTYCQSHYMHHRHLWHEIKIPILKGIL